MDLAEDDALDSRAVAAAELAETAKTMSAPVQASAEKGASLASVGEPQEPITDVTAAPQNTSDPCEAPISPESVSSKNEGEESTTPANAPPAHDPAGPSTPPLESILSPPSKNPGQKDSFTSAHPSQEPSAPSNQVSGPLADFIPPPIPPFKQKSLPTAKPPSTTYRERSARFKRKRQAKQNGPQAFASGTAYPFHHSFRAIPGEKLPNGQSPYPGTAPPGAPLYSPLVAPPKGDFLNATALARLTGTYLGFPWLSIAVSGPPNLGAISQDGRARKKRMKGADTEAPRMVQESPPSSLMSFDTERKPRWKPAPEGFTKCAACVWSRRATGYCYLKHGGEQGGTRVKPVLANDGASEKDVPGDRSDGDDGGGRKSVRVERISADDGASEKDVGGERSEGEGREGPVKDADKGGEGGPSEAEGSETVPEKAPDGDKVQQLQATLNKVPAEPMASPDGNTGGNSTEAPSPAEAVKDRELSEEREGKEVGEADITEGVGGKGNRQAAGGEEDVVQKDDAGGNEHGDDAGKGNVQADDRASGKETGGPIENGEGLNATDKANAEESEKGLLRKQQTGGEESCEEDGEGIDATDKGKGEGSEKELLQGEQAGAKGVVGAQDGQPVAGAVSGPSGSAASEPVTSEPQSKGEAQGGATVTNSQPSVGFSFITDEEPPRGKRKQPDEKGPGRPKPCNACRKVRKGGCGTPRAYSGCEVWKPEVREWPRKRGEERELRPWPAHLPPEAHAQIQTVAADPSRADPNASTASRIPYLYFGRSPSEVDPGSENGAGVSPAPYSRLTPASYLSRLNQSSAVASGPPFVDLFAEPPSNWQARSGLVPNPGPGLLSQQVSQIFSPPHAALGSHQPGGPLLPQIAQLINFPPVGLHPVIGNGVRKPVPSGKASRAQNPQIAVSRHAGVPVKMLNPNGRTPDANPVVPLSNILPTRIQIPELPMFRNPPTASIGAQLPAPRLTISNQPLLGSFLRGPEPFTGAQTSTDVIRIRGGGSRPTEGKPSADVIRVQAGDPRPAEGQPPADVMRIRGGGPRSRKRKQTDGATGGEEKKARKVAGKKASEEKDGALEKERMAEGTAGGGNDAGVNAEERTGSKERVAERRAAEEGSSGVPPQREGLRRSSRVRKKTEVADQTAKTTSEAGVKGRRKSAAKVSMETSEMAGPSRQGDAHEKEALDGGKARRGRKGKVEATAERGKKATSEGKAEGKESKGRSKGAKKRKKGTDGEFGGVGTSAAKKARGGAKGKGGSGKAPLIVFAHGAGAGSSSPFMQRWRGLLKDATGAVDVVTFDYPYLAGGKKGAPPKAEKLVDFHIETIKAAQEKHPDAPLVLVGKSMGSRVSCMIGGQEESGLDVAAVVCLGYPLKGMGKGPLREQTLLDLKCPVLFVQGSKDSMCPLDSLADVRGRMSADNDLYVVEGGDHGLSVGVKALAAQELTKEEAETAALEAIASFVSPLC